MSLYPRANDPLPRADDWLLRYLPKFPAGGSPILELGCGSGLDAAFLTDRGFHLVAFDRLPVAAARDRAPLAHFLRADLACPLPFPSGAFDAAVASLSLHYLPSRETREAFAEIRRVLLAGSPFAFRVNATDDVHHGAGQGIELEPNYYTATEGSWAEAKRFFDEPSIRQFLDGLFTVVQLEHRTIHRYEFPKQTWECLATAI